MAHCMISFEHLNARNQENKDILSDCAKHIYNYIYFTRLKYIAKSIKTMLNLLVSSFVVQQLSLMIKGP